MSIHSSNKVIVRPDSFNPNALEIDLFGNILFTLSFIDADKLSDDIKSQLLKIGAERRLQELRLRDLEKNK